MTPHAKFHVNLPKRGFLANRWNIRKKCILLPRTYRSDPSADFCTQWLKRFCIRQRCAFWEL